MTELLYLRDHYLREFEGKVTGMRDKSVVLDRTAFYPRGGGQPSDQGVLVSAGLERKVVEVLKEDDDVLHRVDGVPPEVGSRVTGLIDWGRRYAFMRHHSALHVLCGVVFHLFGSLVTGGQIHADRARMDFDLEDLTQDRVRTIEAESNKVIQEGRPITVHFIPREEAMKVPDLIRTKINLLPPNITEVRVVEIEDWDIQADGGTHVANTREIGKLRVVKTENKGRFNKRMEIALEPPIQ